jgi:hypothetical protein
MSSADDNPIDPDGVLADLRERIVGEEPPGLAVAVQVFVAALNERLGLIRAAKAREDGPDGQ